MTTDGGQAINGVLKDMKAGKGLTREIVGKPGFRQRAKAGEMKTRKLAGVDPLDASILRQIERIGKGER